MVGVLGAMFIITLRKQLFNKKVLSLLVLTILIVGMFQIGWSASHLSNEEAITLAKKTVSPYRDVKLKKNQIEVINMESERIAVVIEFAPNNYAEVYIDQLSGEVLEANIIDFHGEDRRIK